VDGRPVRHVDAQLSRDGRSRLAAAPQHQQFITVAAAGFITVLAAAAIPALGSAIPLWRGPGSVDVSVLSPS